MQQTYGKRIEGQMSQSLFFRFVISISFAKEVGREYWNFPASPMLEITYSSHGFMLLV